jgi:hypothetical protein
MNYCGKHKNTYLYETYEATVKELENRTMYYEEAVECRYLICWPGSQRRVHYHTAKLEPNRRVSIDRVNLSLSLVTSEQVNVIVEVKIAGAKVKV